MTRKTLRISSIALIAFAITSCSSRGHQKARTAPPVGRDVVITTIPLLTRELAKTYPFLREDFAKGAVLDGKEVYSFEPSTITVNAGDTLHFMFVNPEDDPHSFVMNDFSVALPPQAITRATYIAKHPGIFDFVCAIPSHLPMMRGQLIVLTAAGAQ